MPKKCTGSYLSSLDACPSAMLGQEPYLVFLKTHKQLFVQLPKLHHCQRTVPRLLADSPNSFIHKLEQSARDKDENTEN